MKNVHAVAMCCYFGALLASLCSVGYLLFYLLQNPAPEVTEEAVNVIYGDMDLDVKCFYDTEQYLSVTPNEYSNATEGGNETSIIFIETSCKGGLDSKEACAVESAAKWNPNWTVIVLFTGPISSSFKKSDTFSTLSSLRNIKFSRLNITELAKEETLKEFLRYIWTFSKYPIVHSSEILRTLWLYKYGGIYLDLDVIVLRSFDSLPKNFVVKKHNKTTSCPIMAMSTYGVGRDFLSIALEDLRASYDPKSLFRNSPRLLYRTLKKICITTNVQNMTNETCNGLSLLNSEMFEPIDSRSWRNYYEEYADATLIQNNGSYYTHHLWNAFGGRTNVTPHSLFAQLAEKYCPDVFNLYNDEFGSYTFFY